MIVVTYTYRETAGTQRMAESVKRQGYELAVVQAGMNPHDIMKALYECYKRAATGHDKIIYADAADTYFQRPVNVPDNHILYSTEKQCFPFVTWADRFGVPLSPWRFLNNGLMCGPSELIVEYFDRYGLNDIKGNAQAAAMEAYFQALKDGFPVSLDQYCEEFQSVAFEEPGEFEMKDGYVHNMITGTIPAVLHGNGLTPLEKFIV